MEVKALYIHIPFCDGKCYYCAFYSIPYREEIADAYLASLEKEMSLYKGIAPTTIYIGGGTPGILTIKQWEQLLNAIKNNFSVELVEEWSVEINPSLKQSDLLNLFIANGINRLSVGVQSFRQEALNWLGRRHTVEDSISTLNAIRKNGFVNFSIDLIAGVPVLELVDWQNQLEEAIAFDPSHISIYMLTPDEGSILAKAMKSKEAKLLSEEDEIIILQSTENFLAKNGLRRYEISNYAKKGFECKHNCIYWKGERYLGLGTAAASFIGNIRRVNKPDVFEYIRALERGEMPASSQEELSEMQISLDRLVFGLRMMEGVPLELANGFERKLDELTKEDLLFIKNGFLALTEKGKLLADYVAKELFAYTDEIGG